MTAERAVNEATQDLQALPKGWKRIPLSVLCDRLAKGKSPKYADSGPLVVKTRHVYPEGFPVLPRDRSSASYPENALLQEDDLLMTGMGRGAIGRVMMVPSVPEPLVTDGCIFTIRAKPAVLPRYLLYFLRSPSGQEAIFARESGTAYADKRGQTQIKTPDFATLEVPLPLASEPVRSLEAQRRIVVRLEELLTEIRRARALLEEMRRDTTRMMYAALIEAYSASVTTARGWEYRPLADLCRTTSGGTPNRKNASLFEGTIPWVKSGELKDGLITETKEHISEEAIRASSAKLFPPGTLLIAMYGATVGKLGVLGIESATNQAVCAIFPQERVHKRYLFWFLRFKRRDLVEASFGGAQPNISQTVIRALPVPLAPTLEAQKEISAHLDTVHSEVEQMQVTLDEQGQLLDRLEQSILEEAFRGKL